MRQLLAALLLAAPCFAQTSGQYLFQRINGTQFTPQFLTPQNGMYLKFQGGVLVLDAPAGSGTVTSVDLTVPTGFSVSGNPITASGTFVVNYAAGYQGYTTIEANKLAGIAAGATVGATWGTNITGQPSVVSQAEAEAGVATTERIWTAQRVAQAIAALAPPGVGTVTSVGLVGGDGITVTGASPITSSGTWTLGVNATNLKTALSLNNVENTALSTWAGSTNLTTLGTITTGTWQGSVIGTTYGGLGANNSASSGVPLFATGVVTMTGTSGTGNFARVTGATIDLSSSAGLPVTTGLTAGNWKVFYSNGTGQLVELALGSSGQVLTSQGATSAPIFSTPAGGGNVSDGDTLSIGLTFPNTGLKILDSGDTHTFAMTNTGGAALMTGFFETYGEAFIRWQNGASEVVFDGASISISGTNTGDASLNASLADLFSFSVQELTADDPGADRIYFWDDSAGKATFLTLGTGLSITDTTINASATGGGTNTMEVFTALNNQPPASSYATQLTRNSIAVLEYHQDNDESAIFVWRVPEGADLSGGVNVILDWMAATATSGNVRWRVDFMVCDTDLDSDSFGTATETTSTANGTSGVPTLATIAVSSSNIDGATAGDTVRLRVTRVGTDGTNDTMTGFAQLFAAEVQVQ